MNHKLWVDLDGVLVNWHKGACKCLGIEYPKNSVFYREWICEASQLPIGPLLSKLDETDGFWENLEPSPMAAQMLSFFDSHFPDWGILSSATRNPQSWAGKQAWVKRYLDVKGVHRLVLCCGNKNRFVTPKSILVDDGFKITQDWRQSGGHSFHWIEYTDDRTDAHARMFDDLTAFLTPFIETK